MDKNQKDFLDFARKRLNEGTENMDPDTRQKLIDMRNRAMNIRESKSWLPNWALLPAMGLFTAALYLVLIYAKPVTQPRLDTGLEDLEILSSDDQLDFYEELEFYDWLANKNNEAS